MFAMYSFHPRCKVLETPSKRLSRINLDFRLLAGRDYHSLWTKLKDTLCWNVLKDRYTPGPTLLRSPYIFFAPFKVGWIEVRLFDNSEHLLHLHSGESAV